MHLPLPTAIAATLAALTLTACNDSSSVAGHDTSNQPPNIVFVILDDFGVDQLQVFGYGGANPAHTPNIDAIAGAGLRFRNTWSMPTCSPTRATFFQGRYPFRTDTKNAILGLDLANSQVSPYEVTTPKLLKQKGYVNAVIGKMHLSGSELNPANNPLGNTVMRELGWDYFEGYLDGGPYPIDTSAGGVGYVSGAVYGCGFVPSTLVDPANGADSGACYRADDGCADLTLVSGPNPGRSCLEAGGIFDPGQSCRPTRPAYIDFTTQNGYYTAEWIVNRPDGSVDVIPASDTRSRGYRTIMETDRAVSWVKQQPSSQPWMLSVGYSAIHTPLQPPPQALLSPHAASDSTLTCTAIDEQRALTRHMIEGLDKEIGRLLVELGLASWSDGGMLQYQPEKTNTVVVVMGDNGTYAPSVKAPFNPTRAKGFPYQTGVWVPLIVAGPMVKEPNRDVPHMVNSTDLYSLFAEIVGIDVSTSVPASHRVDAQPLMPYLKEPGRESIRRTNYTEMGNNIRSTGAPPAPPCVIPASNVCVQIFPQQGVCEDQGGSWYGPGGIAGAAGLSSCCAVNDYLTAQGNSVVDILPDSQRAIRDEFYKLVRIERFDCASSQVVATDELYRIDEATPLPKLDNPLRNLLTTPMAPEIQVRYTALQNEMDTLLASRVQCLGDGNLDLVVDQLDLDGWKRFSMENGGRSSWYDFNHDGKTDETDLAIIRQNQGKDCRAI